MTSLPWEGIIAGLGSILGALVITLGIVKPIITKAMDRDKNIARGTDVQNAASAVSTLTQSVGALAQVVASRQDVQVAVDGCSKLCAAERSTAFDRSAHQLQAQAAAFERFSGSFEKIGSRLDRLTEVLVVQPTETALRVSAAISDQDYRERLAAWNIKCEELEREAIDASDPAARRKYRDQYQDLRANPPKR